MPLFIANWKMYKTYQESLHFAQENIRELIALSSNENKLILAPSFVCLDALNTIFKQSSIALCAQNCSENLSGAYTGEVDATSLAQVGCRYALVGHSERRNLFGETDQIIQQKTKMLFDANIIPIICIGETKEAHQNGETLDVLHRQLESILSVTKLQPIPYCIAYEPLWAIGSGIIPKLDDLKRIFEWLTQTINNPQCTLIYGGSVTEKNSADILQIPHVGGLLIGGASCNFQSLKKIVSLG